MDGEAPDENREFCILERYRYLTKVRCYLSRGEYLMAQSLLEKLRYYAEKYHRTYIRMEVCLLSAITKYRMGWEWKEEFFTVYKEAESYHFLRIISEEGAAAQELSMKVATVKYHAAENYRKLGVSGKADAVLAARNLGIL